MAKIVKHYSFLELISLSFHVILSKLICKDARLIRTPIIIRGNRFVNWGKGLTTGKYCRIEAYSNTSVKQPSIEFGDNVQLNDHVHICALSQVYIGSDTLIASNVYISDNSHGAYQGTDSDSSPLVPPIQRDYSINPVRVGNRVWIGEGVMIMPGVTIGDGAVIGAHSVVKTDVPENCMVVGAPARIVKKYNLISCHWEKVNVREN